MRPGDLAHVVIPIPSIFEPIHGDPVKVIKSGDLVLLLKNEPTGWYLPCWQVLFEDQVGILASRWIRPYKPACCEYFLSEEGTEAAPEVDELIELLPEAERLVKVLDEALRKDPGGTAHVTKEERKQIKEIVGSLALKIAKDTIE